jgi:hypothetical protein
MKHIHQGPSECKLATIAMLADVSLEECRVLVCKATDTVTWESVLSCGKEAFWKGIDALLPLVEKLPVKILMYKELLPIVNGVTSSFGGVTKYMPNESLPLQGKGEMFVGYWFRNHSVAYENGIIYDPEMYKECSFDEWMKLRTEKIKYFIL